jgi:hypothetical protein
LRRLADLLDADVMREVALDLDAHLYVPPPDPWIPVRPTSAFWTTSTGIRWSWAPFEIFGPLFARHYTGKPESSGLLKVRVWVGGRQFGELRPADRRAAGMVGDGSALRGQRRQLLSPLGCGGGQDV